MSTPVSYPETTVITDYGTAYTTLYFRNDFQLNDPAQVAELIFRIDYDDGFIAYLNGHEIARRGIPAGMEGWIPYNTLATAAHYRGYTETINVSASIPHLLPGKNMLAIQSLGRSNPDFSFSMVSELAANFTRGPFLQLNTTNSVTIVSKTFSPSIAFVDFVPEAGGEIQRVIADQLPATNHVARITGLLPGTKYRYRAGATLNAKEVFSEWNSFSTFRMEGPARFLVMGDSGWATRAQIAIANQLAKQDTDMLMHVGDVVYAGYSHFAADFRMFSIYEQFMKNNPVFIAMGNHDSYVDRTAILENFYLPTNSMTGSETFYSFDQGDVHFVALWLDLQAGAQYFPGSVQYNWLEEDLKKTTKPWKFIFFHHVLRSSGPHTFDDYDQNTVRDTAQIEQSIGVLAARYGVQAIFNGHDHNYERFIPVNGTVAFVSGGGGAALYPLSLPHPLSANFLSRFNFLLVEVEEDTAKVEAVGEDGRVFDTIHIRKSFPEKQLRHSHWHTPQIQSGPANDGDANITNQRFDFAGANIPSKTGTNSMAGRLYVNNDGRHVYFGLDEVSIGKDQNLFLFLGNRSTLGGVVSMRGLGNGVVDPQGEGADGIDFLENVEFRNFAPTVAVILGDEAADGPSRSFLRHGMPMAVGQGAYYLGAQIASVPGQQLQQYNRSPQEIPYPFEQNANFIEVKIPYTSLGFYPGQTIQVAVVASTGFTLAPPDLQAIPLDTSGGIAGSITVENEMTIIEPIEVQLATGDFELQAERVDNGEIRLFWFSIPGKKYQIQVAETVTSSFTNLASDPETITATGYEVSSTIRANETARFFRVVEIPSK
ncbi:MAG: metallophosphoesterase [Verrucomicrobiales bacterium]